MKKSVLIIIITLLLISFAGCPHEKDPIMNTEAGLIDFYPYRCFQDDYDYIMLHIENHNNKPLNNIYMRPIEKTPLEISIIGEPFTEYTIHEKNYYCFDALKAGMENDIDYYVLLKYEKNSIFKGGYYEQKLKKRIILYSFDVYFNYSELGIKIRNNMRFYFYPSSEDDPDEVFYAAPMYVLPDFNSIIESTMFKSLYLPFSDIDSIALNKQSLYCPDDNVKLSIKCSEPDMSLIILTSSEKPTNSSSIHKVYYKCNGIRYTITTRDGVLLPKPYYLSFNYYEPEIGYISYHYTINCNDIDEAKKFAQSINKFE